MIRVGIIGVGNIASMFIQSIHHYRNTGSSKGLIHRRIGRYSINDIDVVYAVDVSKYKVGKELSEAIFQPPNQVPKFVDLKSSGVTVKMGKVLDGVAEHMVDDFTPSNLPEPSAEVLARDLEDSGVDVLVNLLPVGSSKATRFYAEVASMAGVAFVNCIPEFIASDEEFSKLFEVRRTTLLGDDIKGQLGATIVHRALARLISMRGGEVMESYQLNVGGNTDFKNMLEQSRLHSKKLSKSLAVASTQPDPYEALNKVFAGPNGFIPFLGNTKVSYIYIKALGFMELPVVLDVKLVVDDKAMASAILVDAVRLAKVLRDLGIFGAPPWASAPYFKHPPNLVKSDEEALEELYVRLEEYGVSIEPKYVF
ncbi:MAG: inositol-3-phosphate synthase [Sulfolobales archaeon]